ncbi:MAG TPA: PDZ domain-containing protein [Gammaproteobacteria bacterium]|nr:PDZ domain-containing protein [Gammaproteobacteria bacterium]
MKSIFLAVLYLFVGLLAGFGVAAVFSDDSREPEAPMRAAEPVLQRRLERLESNLDAVVADNAELQLRIERLDALLGESVLQPVRDPESHAAAGDRSAVDAGDAARGDGSREAENVRSRSRFRNRERDLRDALTDAGFSFADAERIETRLEQLRLEAMQTRYEALRSGEPQGSAGERQRGEDTLRAELGDADYERFRAATGRPTSVGVTSVIASSAAETAGIREGDEIRAYDGARVFDVRDLNRALLEGVPGEPVLVDLVRDGQPIQVVIARGPLGISSGFGRRGAR